MDILNNSGDFKREILLKDTYFNITMLKIGLSSFPEENFRFFDVESGESHCDINKYLEKEGPLGKVFKVPKSFRIETTLDGKSWTSYEK